MELQIRNLSKTYPNGVEALKDVTLTIPQGMYGLLGPNGAGKSTLMRTIATLQEPDAGSIRFGDIDVLAERERVRETLGYLPQEFGVYPRASAEELLEHFAVLKGLNGRRERREVVEALLRQTNLYDVRRKKLGGYSGGMRQRFGVAVALLGDPRLIIVDEPTAGLDPAERVRFLNLLSEIGQSAVVILSTHIVEDVSELYSRMAVIDRGEILLEAEPLAAVAALRGRIWRRVVEKAELPELERSHAVISTKLLAGRTIVRANGRPDAGFEPAEPDLEDVYFSTLFSNPTSVQYQEGFSFINPVEDPRGIDLPFAVVAHEVAHQWWGNRLVPALVVGAPVLNESLAWYSALEVVEAAHGREHRDRLLGAMWATYQSPRARAGPPLLRAAERFLWYRKGVLAMHALREYVGAERVNAALRRFFEKYGSATPPLPTTLDLYRELQAVTPEELRYLLADMFEANTYWELSAKRVEAERVGTGEWRVTLDVRARKVVVDEAGVETEVAMDDFVEIGVFAPAEDGGAGKPLYMRMHRVRSGEQRITLTVPGEPAHAGIDPRNLLIDIEPGDNFAEVTVSTKLE